MSLYNKNLIYTCQFVLLLAAAAALVWANSPFAGSYEALWHLPLSFGIGGLAVSRSLHFWINDGLMTVFFLVVGMEIRREIHEGALRSLRQASLPLAAAATKTSPYRCRLPRPLPPMLPLLPMLCLSAAPAGSFALPRSRPM